MMALSHDQMKIEHLNVSLQSDTDFLDLLMEVLKFFGKNILSETCIDTIRQLFFNENKFEKGDKHYENQNKDFLTVGYELKSYYQGIPLSGEVKLSYRIRAERSYLNQTLEILYSMLCVFEITNSTSKSLSWTHEVLQVDFCEKFKLVYCLSKHRLWCFLE